MYDTSTRRRAVALMERGLSLRGISLSTGINRSTLREWRDKPELADAFTKAIAAGHSDGSGWNGLIPAIMVVAIAGLAIGGTWRRVTEYR